MARHRALVRLMVARFGRDRWNEHVKLVCNLFGAVAAASLIGAIVAPIVNATPTTPAAAILLVLVAFVAHLCAHAVLRYIASKD